MIADSRRAALAMFPDKELAYDLIWRPRFQRLMRERFRIMCSRPPVQQAASTARQPSPRRRNGPVS